MRLMRVSSIFDQVKQDAIKVDFRGINKFYGERIKQQFFFKEDYLSIKFLCDFRGGWVSSIFW